MKLLDPWFLSLVGLALGGTLLWMLLGLAIDHWLMGMTWRASLRELRDALRWR